MKARMPLQLCWLAVLSLAGCGGGSGGGGLSLTLSPSPLSAQLRPGDLPTTLQVSATVSGTTSATTVYVLIADPAGTFAPGQVGVSQTGPDTYTAYLPLPTGLSVGAHAGTLQVRLCADPACQSQVGSASLPYSVTISPPTVSGIASPLAVSAIQDGAATISMTIAGAPRDTATYAVVRDGGGIFVTGQAINLGFASIPLSPLNASAVLAVVPGLSTTAHHGTVLLDICGDAACTQVYNSLSLPTTAQVLGILAGQPGVAGSADGLGAAASFSAPYGIALDTSGTLFVADYGNSEVRKVLPDGTVSAYPGPMTLSPTPQSIGVDAAGDVFFSKNAEAPGNGPSKIAPDGTITQFGINFILLNEDPAGGIAFDSAGKVYTTETSNAYLDVYVPSGLTHSRLTSSLLSNPLGIVIDSGDNVYVCDSTIVMFSPSGTATTLASPGFRSYYGAMDGFANLYVTNLSAVYQVTPSGAVTTAVAPGAVYPSGAPYSPLGIAMTAGRLLLLSDSSNNVILQTTLP